MAADKSADNSSRSSNKMNVAFLFLGSLLCLNFAAISLVGREFRYENENELPIILVTTLYFVASALALAALVIGLRSKFTMRQLFICMFVFAASFRIIQVLSPPILEVDLYRYLWDGMVTNEGISPYRFAPQEALFTGVESGNPDDAAALKKIQNLAIKNQTIHTIAQRVHFREYSTIYPPVSQFFFAVTTWCVPDDASVEAHVFAMKFMLVLFDLATIVLVWKTITTIRVHPAWIVAYAWNPLVIKEIANSGHLDSIAVFFLVLAVYGMVRLLAGAGDSRQMPTRWIVTAAIAASLGAGAKIFPIVVAPLLLIALARFKFRSALLFAAVFVVATTVVMSPMLLQNKLTRNISNAESDQRSIEQTKEGLSSFLTQWRMNDLVFSCILENARPDDDRVINRPWYVVVPDSSRRQINQQLSEAGVSGNIPFHIARGVTLTMFGLVYGLLIVLWWRNPTTESFLNVVFIVVATFFFLQPTQNPWYWLWAMPWVCFARNRGWLIVSLLLFSYYLRFWFENYDGTVRFAGIDYQAEGIFDYIGVFVEFGLVGLSLVGCGIWNFWKRKR